MKKINVISNCPNIKLYEKKSGDWILYLSKKICDEWNLKEGDEVNLIVKDRCLIIMPQNKLNR